MSEGKILIVDDNRSVLSALELLLQSQFEKVTGISNPNRIPEMLDSEDFDLVVLDMNFKAGINSGNEGLFWLREVMSHDRDISVVMITAYGDVELAVKAIRREHRLSLNHGRTRNWLPLLSRPTVSERASLRFQSLNGRSRV
ncbi:MAG: response regulator [Bacteroidales bacterium]